MLLLCLATFVPHLACSCALLLSCLVYSCALLLMCLVFAPCYIALTPCCSTPCSNESLVVLLSRLATSHLTLTPCCVIFTPCSLLSHLATLPCQLVLLHFLVQVEELGTSPTSFIQQQIFFFFLNFSSFFFLCFVCCLFLFLFVIFVLN